MTEEVSDDDGKEQEAFQSAEHIYNVRGNVNYFISEYRNANPADLMGRLEGARRLLEAKKYELFKSVKSAGWNSKDARSLVEDCSLYRDQVVAVKQTFTMHSADLPSHRLDAESLGQAVQRFLQIEENLRKQEAERAERARLEEEQRVRSEEAERARVQEQERQRSQDEAIGCIVKGVGVIVGIGVVLWLIGLLLAWIGEMFARHPIISTLVLICGVAGGTWLFILWADSKE